MSPLSRQNGYYRLTLKLTHVEYTEVHPDSTYSGPGSLAGIDSEINLCGPLGVATMLEY